jgi:hypothetical protein
MRWMPVQEVQALLRRTVYGTGLCMQGLWHDWHYRLYVTKPLLSWPVWLLQAHPTYSKQSVKQRFRACSALHASMHVPVCPKCTEHVRLRWFAVPAPSWHGCCSEGRDFKLCMRIERSSKSFTSNTCHNTKVTVTGEMSWRTYLVWCYLYCPDSCRFSESVRMPWLLF